MQITQIRSWLFFPGADTDAHDSLNPCEADALIVDLEDFTPPQRRPAARALLPLVLDTWRARGQATAVRINTLDGEGPADLAAAMLARPDFILYPMADSAAQMGALDAAITDAEQRLGLPAGATGIVPVCETARGVADVRAIAAGSVRVQAALLGTEDLAADLMAERSPESVELAYARQRFLLECRAQGIEPIDSPYTFADVEGLVREATHSRRLGYRCKSLVRAEHAAAVNAVFTPDVQAIARAQAIVDGFLAARARGEDRARVGELWVEVPTFRSAQRLLARAAQLKR